MSGTVASRVSLSKRLLLAAVLAAVTSIVLVPGAAAGNFDEEKMGCTGENPATCATGTVGQPYSVEIYLVPPDGGRGEDFGCATFHPAAGFPPGLSISDEGFIHGTPTQDGTFQFYITVQYDKEPGCFKPASDDQFIIKINPGVPVLPKLTIGPEQDGVSNGTVGTPYTLPMTASVADPKTWSISAGSLPPGLAINPADGVISGTPTASGTFGFTVLAVIDANRSDTKSLSITVRDPLAITPPAIFDEVSSTAHTEVGVRFITSLAATGGLGPYTWTLTGTLPDGLVFDDTTGSLIGRPELPGTYRFGLSVADSEGRTIAYAGRIVVAPRLAIVTKRLRPGKVGRLFRQKLRSTGGVAALEIGDVSVLAWRVKRGPLPRGIRFDKTTASFVGIPVKRGTWVVMVEIVDALRVKATAAVRIVVAAPPKPKKR